MSQEGPSLECNHAATLINCRFIASRTVRKHTHVAEYTMKKNEPATHISMPTKMSLTTLMGTTIYNPMRCESDGSGHGHVGAQSGSPQAPHQSNLSCFPVATPAATAQGKARGEGTPDDEADPVAASLLGLRDLRQRLHFDPQNDLM